MSFHPKLVECSQRSKMPHDGPFVRAFAPQRSFRPQTLYFFFTPRPEDPLSSRIRKGSCEPKHFTRDAVSFPSRWPADTRETRQKQSARADPHRHKPQEKARNRLLALSISAPFSPHALASSVCSWVAFGPALLPSRSNNRGWVHCRARVWSDASSTTAPSKRVS